MLNENPKSRPKLDQLIKSDYLTQVDTFLDLGGPKPLDKKKFHSEEPRPFSEFKSEIFNEFLSANNSNGNEIEQMNSINTLSDNNFDFDET